MACDISCMNELKRENCLRQCLKDISVMLKTKILEERNVGTWNNSDTMDLSKFD